MHKSGFLVMLAPMALMACDANYGKPQSEFIPELPERVLEIAAPYQDLNAVKIDPADGCYVYRHIGPVETTFLPLRTRDGRPICTRAPDAPAPDAAA